MRIFASRHDPIMTAESCASKHVVIKNLFVPVDLCLRGKVSSCSFIRGDSEKRSSIPSQERFLSW